MWYAEHSSATLGRSRRSTMRSTAPFHPSSGLFLVAGALDHVGDELLRALERVVIERLRRSRRQRFAMLVVVRCRLPDDQSPRIRDAGLDRDARHRDEARQLARERAPAVTAADDRQQLDDAGELGALAVRR